MSDKESVVGVMKDLRTGFLGRNSFTLVVTDRRLIFAKYSMDLMKQEREKSLEGSQDSGFFGKWKATISSGFNFHERYFDMDPQVVLQEDEDNYQIKFGEIKSVKISGRGFDPDFDRKSQNEMEIQWAGGKDKFKFRMQSPKQVKEILNPLLGKKIY